MNILFYTTNEVAPQYGGVERVTANIANALTTFYNVNCYSAYKYNIDKSFIKQQFVNTIKINSCLLYTSPSPRDPKTSRMPSSA